MPEPNRVQLRRTKGWRLPPDCFKVDRTGGYGNRYRIHRVPGQHVWRVSYVTAQQPDRLYPTESEARTAAVNLYTAWLHNSARRDFRNHIRIVFGPGRARPACWCSIDDSCHGDAIWAVACTPSEPENDD